MAKLSRFDIESAQQEQEQIVWQQRARVSKSKKTVANKSLGPVVRTTDQGKTVRVWSSQLDTNAWNQSQQFANLPFVHAHGMALMPDVHPGKDVPVGAVLPTVGVLVPAAVGVDIGCGMIACKLNVSANHLPDNLRQVRLHIEKTIPMGTGGFHKNIPDHVMKAWSTLEARADVLAQAHPKAIRPRAYEHLGTLGAGNHFVEICLDESKDVWIMLHSGSRGAGSAIGTFFIEQARQRVQANGEKKGPLGWLHANDPLFDAYVKAVGWAQDFAHINRQCMLEQTLQGLSDLMQRPIHIVGHAINCHHNYVSQEHHHGADVWVTRKGAIRARKDEWGIIPSAMGQESYIVQGLGNEDAWCSCSHGAGRVMSRAAAKSRFTRKDLRSATEGLECRKDRAIIDEIPYAYKPIHAVMKDQRDLVKVVHTLKAVVCMKGV